jgi:hypothetical protein
MEQFHDGRHVWLRSRELGTYLHADEDGHGVSLTRHRASMNAAWAVHLDHGDGGDAQHLLLHSAAYGRYLAATDAKAPRRCRGFRVAQRDYDELEEESVRWEPMRLASGDHEDDIVLRHVDARFPGLHGRYLRANGRHLRWNKAVSVDHFRNASTMMEWVVEPIRSTERMPRLPRPIGVSSPSPCPA